ncbi:MAG TPA: hypothetical protein VHJ39_06275 [Solirubrobacteraceae bacterium]|nr:hypothetical protein [Solirubrobacteraceae bacterium]
MTQAVDVGAGQAGLSVGRELTLHAVPHVVLEGARVGQAWRDRWDSFCLVTPNWSVRLPGEPYEGEEPDGYMPRDEVVGQGGSSRARTPRPARAAAERVDLAGFGAVVFASGFRPDDRSWIRFPEALDETGLPDPGRRDERGGR